MVVGETKLDDSYPTSQFIIAGYSHPFRLDRDKHGGGLLIYVRDCIPCKQLHKHTFPRISKAFSLNLISEKNKWLLFRAYHPPSQNDEYFF